jgi:hypothetical protein
MDPTDNLCDQIMLAEVIQGHLPFLDEDGERLAHLVLDLDEWLRKGGALPEPWRKKKGKKR